MNDRPDPATPRKRTRLQPDVRARQILDAALVEFSEHGFARTRVEDIARRARLSKSGIYAHYASKDAIFDALLMTVLAPMQDGGGDGLLPTDPDLPLQDIVDGYLDRIYSRLQHPDLAGVFRLMVADSDRAAGSIRRWHEQVVDRYRAKDQAVVEACVRRGTMRRGVLSECFELASAPAVQWLIGCILLQGQPRHSLARTREMHRRLLLELLAPV